MARYCPCGKQVYSNRGICKECGSIYGFTRSEWPEWLKMMVNDLGREDLFELRHEHLSYDEIEPNGRGGYRAKREFALRGCRTETHLYEDRAKH